MVHFHVFRVNRGNFSLYLLYFSCYFFNKGISPLILVAYLLAILEDLEIAIEIKNAWSIYLQAFFFSDLLAKLLLNFAASDYTKSNVHSFVFQNRTRSVYSPGFFLFHLKVNT
jgi:hypothetical protein